MRGKWNKGRDNKDKNERWREICYGDLDRVKRPVAANAYLAVDFITRELERGFHHAFIVQGISLNVYCAGNPNTGDFTIRLL